MICPLDPDRNPVYAVLRGDLYGFRAWATIVGRKLRWNFVGFEQPDSAIFVVAKQFLILIAHISRPNHLLAVDIRAVIHPVQQWIVIRSVLH